MLFSAVAVALVIFAAIDDGSVSIAAVVEPCYSGNNTIDNISRAVAMIAAQNNSV